MMKTILFACFFALPVFAQDACNNEPAVSIPDPPNVISEVEYVLEHCEAGPQYRFQVHGKTVCMFPRMVCQKRMRGGFVFPEERLKFTIAETDAECPTDPTSQRCPSPGRCYGDTTLTKSDVDSALSQYASKTHDTTLTSDAHPQGRAQ